MRLVDHSQVCIAFKYRIGTHRIASLSELEPLPKSSPPELSLSGLRSLGADLLLFACLKSPFSVWIVTFTFLRGHPAFGKDLTFVVAAMVSSSTPASFVGGSGASPLDAALRPLYHKNYIHYSLHNKHGAQLRSGWSPCLYRVLLSNPPEYFIWLQQSQFAFHNPRCQQESIFRRHPVGL